MRWRRWTSAVWLGFLALQVAGSASPSVLARAEQNAAPTEVGVTEAGGTAFELIGQTGLRGERLGFYGYLTRVVGLDDELLFTDPDNPGPDTSRLTVFGTRSWPVRLTLTA